ncbi:hypothetical protein K431DRAFT_286110 [Polychaeton citri CBS 116435]|uniref:Uncharacterized protein n=1 Tax=Polychaeton citri CBS 116435 TaxID=1314669 RepID=A0A9P4UP53_9PEZI|nr:hypothetical protein K431DRAFT_286110 [Polychaeton citri CBS 116435]
MAVLLSKRYYGDGCYYNGYRTVCNSSSWYNWGRWVVLAIIIIAAFILFFTCSCYSARRRRRMGYSPYRGTGWALGRTPAGHAPATYNAQPYYANQQQSQPYYNNSNNPPPAYTQSNGAAQDYYGGRNDVELQQPPVAYGGAQYQPPKGPPPARS